MNNYYRKVIYKNGYLLIIAAWLYTLSFIVGNYFNYRNTPLQVKNKLEHYLAEQESFFEKSISNINLFTKLINPAADKAEYELYDAHSGIFVYKLNKDSTGNLMFWSKNSMMPYDGELKYDDGYYFTEHTNGYYELIKKTIPLDSSIYIALSLIPIKSNYFFENEYIKNNFIIDNSLSKYYDIYEDSGIPIVNSQGKALFNIDRVNENPKIGMSVWEGVLKGLALFFCLVFLNYLVIAISERKNFKTGLIVLISTILVLRISSYFIPFPFNFRQFKIFDPTIFASSAVHSSLGAVIINSVLVLWITKFFRYRYDFSKNISQSEKINKISGYCLLILFVIVSFYLFSLVHNIVIDSNIPFNVTNFFSLNIYTIAGFFAIAVIILVYYNISYIMLISASKYEIPLWVKAVTAFAVAAIITFLFPNNYSLTFKIGSVIWITGYIIYLHFHIYDLKARLVRSPYFIFWAIFYSFSAALLMSDDEKFEQAKIDNVIHNLSQRSMNIDENMLKLSIAELNDNLHQQNLNRLRDSSANEFIKDSIYTNNLAGYLNNFYIYFFTYEKNGTPLYNEHDISKAKLDSTISLSLPETDAPNLFYYETDSSANNAYVYRNTITSSIDTAFLYVYMKEKDVEDNNLYLQLLSQNDEMKKLYRSYHIGIYRNGKITNETLLYDFPDTISVSSLPVNRLVPQKSLSEDKYWYRSPDDRVVSIVKRTGFMYSFLALFSYLLLFTMLFILLISLIHFLIEARFKPKVITQRVQFSFRTRIYTSIIFVALFSFIIIGGASISFYLYNNEKETVARLFRVMSRFAKETALDLGNAIENASVKNNPESINNFLLSEMSKLAQVGNENINFYTSDGMLLYSSQPYIYKREILSPVIQPFAYNELSVNKKKDFYQTEHIEKFSYISGYMPVNYKDKNIGYLNVPFLNLQNVLNQNISSFITVVVCIIALVFMLAGIMSVFLTQKIIDSFNVIKGKMRKINLGENTEEIYWEKGDEVGELIEEFNKMLRKLQESASQLARSEREGAWSLMARQVAHEIKNPLTPMKLNLQFLQRMAESGEMSPELTKRLTESMIEQTDQLAIIASDFSQFANIGNVRLEEFHVSDVLQKLVNLHSVNEDLQIVYTHSGNDEIYADKTQINRLFTNLIKNALEASAQNEKAAIDINSQQIGKNILVSVHDHGAGITEEQAAKIFVPNFTTKSSGTGLGLAISKVIVENAKGRIWFESIQNIGTTFYVSFPLHIDEEDI